MSTTQITSEVSFKSLALHADIARALTEEGYSNPTPIQAKAVPPALQGRDLLGCAQTGTGKTAAFALPVLHRLLEETPEGSKKRASPRALILAPTRELATQIADSFATYGRHTPLRGAVVYGGVSQVHQVKRLERGIDILVATPGRLIDLMEQQLVDLRHIQIFILDEADRMLDMGFIHPIRRIAQAVPGKRQTMLFSATMPKPIMHLADSLLHDPVRITVAPVRETTELIEQSVYAVSKNRKPALLQLMLDDRAVQRAVVFTRTKHGADKVAKRLKHAGITADAIHGNKAQNQRQRTLDAFRTGKSRVLVATDVAARGLDVDGITHVFNFDLPNEPEVYVHRIGRTGRAGANGIAISFCDHDERGFLRDIERLTGKRIRELQTPNDLPQAAPSRFESDAPSDDEQRSDVRDTAIGTRNNERARNQQSRDTGGRHFAHKKSTKPKFKANSSGYAAAHPSDGSVNRNAARNRNGRKLRAPLAAHSNGSTAVAPAPSASNGASDRSESAPQARRNRSWSKPGRGRRPAGR